MDSAKIKALETTLSSASNAKDKVDVINALAFEIRNLDTNRSIELSKQAQTISSQINYQEGKATALNNEAFCYVQITNYELGLEKSFEALKIFEELKNEKGEALSHYNLALLYQRVGEYNAALEQVTKALAYNQKVNDKFEMARCYMQLGFLYGWLTDNETSIEVYEQGLVLNREINNKAGEAAVIMGMGQTYLQMKEYEKSREFLLKSMEIREQIKDWRGYAASMNALMTLYYETNTFEDAEELSLKGIKLANELGDKMGVCRFMVDLGKIYLKQEKLQEAEDTLNEALSISQKINLKLTVPHANFFLSEVYKRKQDYKKALEYYQRFHESKEEIFSTENAMKAKSTQLSGKIESAQKEAEINRLRNVELKNAYDEIAEKNKDITDSINYAKKIQQALLASDDLLKQNLNEHFVLFRPKDIVSGDFYWSVTKNDSFYLAICDSTGHGVPGAFMSLLNISFLNEALNEKNILEPNEVFNYVRKRLIESFSYDGAQDGMEGTLLRIKTEDKKLKIEYAAAHNAPVLIKNGKLIELPHDKMSIGEGENKNSFLLHTLNLEKGDTLYLYTDGYADQFGGDKQKKFKYKQLHEILSSISNESLAEQKIILEKTFENWKGNNPQTDDVLVIGIKA